MSRAPSGSFAQYFPSAPRAARDKAKERERSKLHISESSATVEQPELHEIGPVADESERAGDILNGVGSASSHTSTVSSVFSAPTQHHNMTTMASLHNMSSFTPLTNHDSSPLRVSSPKSSAAAFNSAHTVDDSLDLYNDSEIAQLTLEEPIATNRILARDPAKTVKGQICTYNPEVDRTPGIDGKKKTKPIYEDFGVEDDAPPADPRLAKGGRLGYINTDFHLPGSRLRHAPYLLKPYAYDPRTSLGAGPPTQVVVKGYDPLINFSSVSAVFTSFGDVAESSNKLHPELGVCLGFGTFRYRDSRTKDGRFIPAIEAAKMAVRKGNNTRIGTKNIIVEFDPDGVKSRRLLESAEKAYHVSAAQAKVVPSKIAETAKSSGPPPTAPRGPAAYAQRAVLRTPMPMFAQTPAPATVAVPTVPTKPRSQRVVEETGLARALANVPYLFIPATSVPTMPTTIPHMKKRMRHFYPDDVVMDRTGYFIAFPNTASGRSYMKRCYESLNRTLMFTYTMEMEMFINSTSGSRDVIETQDGGSRKRSRSPPRQNQEQLEKNDAAARQKEEEADLEEERKERTENFDPSREAIEIIKRELKAQIMGNVRDRIANPCLHSFMDPVKHLTKRRKLNLTDPSNLQLHFIDIEEEGDRSPGFATPSSQADTSDRRVGITGKLNISSLPRIRKNANAKKVVVKDSRWKKSKVRLLQHRVVDSDDENSDREDRTAEPESRSRSRIVSEDEESGDENSMLRVPRSHRDDASVDTPEEDFSDMPEDTKEASKKRKLDAASEAARKRQKKSDEELFGVAPEQIETDLPGDSDATKAVDDGHVETEEESRARRNLAKSAKRKKSKKQMFEEREALKRQQEGVYLQEVVRDVSESPEKEEEEEEEEDAEFIRETAPTETTVEWGMSAQTPRATVDDDFENVIDLDGLKNLLKDDEDAALAVKLIRDKGTVKMPSVETWAWRQEEIKAINRNGHRGLVTVETGIDGFYRPNVTGCARTEGTRKILNVEKSMYLPHRLRVQREREERQALAKRAGKNPAEEAAQAAKLAAERLLAQGNSRASRVSNRQYIANLNEQKRSVGGADSDVFRFNQLQKRKKPVKFARSAIHNWGLYSMENIPREDMIIEYVGEKVRQQVADFREHLYTRMGIGSSYLFRIDEAFVVDATKKGGIARFINHSCMPNCTAKIINVEKTKRIVIYALRDIAQNEELTYDYKFEREIGSTDRVPCLCGTTACKGFLN